MAFTFPKPIELIPQGTKIPFVSYFKLFFGLSTALNLITIVLLFTVGLNFGIDFRGGTVMQIRAPQAIDVSALRAGLAAEGFGDAQIQSIGSPNEVLIRISERPGGDKAQQEAAEKVKAVLSNAIGQQMEVRNSSSVGSTVSGELLERAVWALALTCLGVFIYVWLRFEWQFALGAIVALVHDVLLTVGVFAAFQLDFDLTVVAALLTILGYSINDTVVIYDRIRENLRKYKKMPLDQLLDLSVNETLSRTIMTVGTTFLALLALYLFGGEVIRGFTFGMLFGVVVGTYSSVFIAAPFLILIGIKRDWSTVKIAPKSGGRARSSRDES